MDDKARLQLQKMIKANDVEDQTGLIRELKHSHLLQNDINQLLMLMAKYRNDQTKVHEEAISACGFLFTYYTDIYNKIVNKNNCCSNINLDNRLHFNK